MTPVDVQLDADVPEVTAAEIARVVEGVLAAEEAESLCLSVVVVDDDAIHDINRRFLGHDRPTDVIAFDLRDGGPGVDGEIFVSTTTARREAAERGVAPEGELLLYCVHGALHLLGYDDKEPGARTRMHARQRALLANMGYETSE